VFKESIGPVESGLRQGLPQETAAKIAPANPGADPAAPAPTAVKQDARRVRRVNSLQRVAQSSGWLIPLIEVVEVLGILFFLVQLPVTLAAVRLEFELHWYIVTDRSLRIRSGLLRLQESTMSFANLQQVEVKQGPLQRWLGLADVRVQSAGGGGGQSPHGQTDDSLHTGVFHSVDNASEIRDLILERLRRFRMAGLGDPEDHHAVIVGGVPPPGGISAPDATVLAAAHELLAEARALRAALS
jgi:membrane protein YdbS with pleckstrin-like domain